MVGALCSAALDVTSYYCYGDAERKGDEQNDQAG